MVEKERNSVKRSVSLDKDEAKEELLLKQKHLLTRKRRSKNKMKLEYPSCRSTERESIDFILAV